MVVRQRLLGNCAKHAAGMINSPRALVITEIHFYAGIHFPTRSLQQTKHYLQDEGWNYPLLYKFPAVLRAMWQPWCEWEYRESQCQILLWTSSTIWHSPLAHGEWEVAASSQHILLYFSLGNSITQTHTQSHVQAELHLKHSKEMLWSLWGSAATCARSSMLLLGFPTGLQPGPELRKHQPCFGTKLLSILFFLAVERVAPGLIYCMPARPCSQMLIS